MPYYSATKLLDDGIQTMTKSKQAKTVTITKRIGGGFYAGITPKIATITTCTVLLAGGGLSVYHEINEESLFTTYIDGYVSNPYHLAVGVMVGSRVQFDDFCAQPEPLLNAEPGSVVFSIKRDSINCNHSNFKNVVSFSGGDDTPSDICTKPRPDNTIIISNGSDYGDCVDFYFDKSPLPFAFAEAANTAMALNTARVTANLDPLNNKGIKTAFNASSDAFKTGENGENYGKIIDLEKLMGTRTAATSTPIISAPSDSAGIVPIINFILGD